MRFRIVGVGLIICSLLLGGCQAAKQAPAVQKNQAAEVKSQSVEKALTWDYFVPDTNHDLHYREVVDLDQKNASRYTIRWKQVGVNRFEENITLDGGIFKSLYATGKDGICQVQWSEEYQESEGALNKVTSGSNLVFRFARPGESWNCSYKVTDNWGSLTENTDTYHFEGFEKVKVMGKTYTAAHISFKLTDKVAKEDPQTPLAAVAGSTRGSYWYVKGLGLVKGMSDGKYEDNSFSSTWELVGIEK